MYVRSAHPCLEEKSKFLRRFRIILYCEIRFLPLQLLLSNSILSPCASFLHALEIALPPTTFHLPLARNLILLSSYSWRLFQVWIVYIMSLFSLPFFLCVPREQERIFRFFLHFLGR